MSRRKKSEIQKQPEPMSIRVPREIRLLIEKEAKKRDCTRHALIIDILKRWYAFMLPKQKSEEFRKNELTQ